MITPDIIDWCVTQHVVHFNNAEVSLFVALAFAYLLLLFEPFAYEFEALRWYRRKGVMLSRIIISIVLIVYLLFFKFRVVPLLVVQ